MMGSPLLPASEDIQFVEATAARWREQHGRAPRAVLLGVTPKLAQMNWPAGTSLTAADSSAPMASALWPCNGEPHTRRLVLADWRFLPFPDGRTDILVGDGSINCLRYPDSLRSFARSISRLLSSDGVCVIRCYIQPDRRESPQEVIAQIGSDGPETIHQFKFRLLMALQANAIEGIAVRHVYDYWASHTMDDSRPISRPGWGREVFDVMALYRGVDTVHTFPTRNELRQVLDEFFIEVDVSVPSYYLGERCPTIVLKSRAGCRAG
jgi:SAM-dependent methyltransferase